MSLKSLRALSDVLVAIVFIVRISRKFCLNRVTCADSESLAVIFYCWLALFRLTNWCWAFQDRIKSIYLREGSGCLDASAREEVKKW